VENEPSKSSVYTKLRERINSIALRSEGIWSSFAFGVTASTEPISALLHRSSYSSEDLIRIVVLGGDSGSESDAEAVLEAAKVYLGSYSQSSLALNVVPCANPDLMGAPEVDEYPPPSINVRYPPEEGYFNHPTDAWARYLWRWVIFQGPDLVLEIRDGPSIQWEANEVARGYAESLGEMDIVPEASSFVAALGFGNPGGVGLIPALRVTAPFRSIENEVGKLFRYLVECKPESASLARNTLSGRRERDPIQVARVLAKSYGQTLSPVVYTQGIGISGRLRLWSLEGREGNTVSEIVTMLAPVISPADQMFEENAGTPSLAGLIWAGELSQATGHDSYSALIISVAERYVLGEAGEAPAPSDPNFRTEDMFMNGAMLGRAFAITGDIAYVDMLADFLMQAKVQQENGLFWHSRSVPYYWGRGNGFAAMGFAEALTYIPMDHPHWERIITIHRRHLAALRQIQCPSGMFRQVLDFPGSYEELTATAMVGYAVARGLRAGWLDSSYRDMLDRCWRGVSERVQDDGIVVDGCASTGVQNTLREYLDRPAINGYDDRTGGLALWFAVEIENLKRGLMV
jgi:rhamnogalacturonyl hydrolase YesR